jgi:hypothetical protein
MILPGEGTAMPTGSSAQLTEMQSKMEGRGKEVQW